MIGSHLLILFNFLAQRAATERFVEWLTTTVVHKEVAGGAGGGAGKTKVVLCGHRCSICTGPQN
jgi:hypothetical protein